VPSILVSNVDADQTDGWWTQTQMSWSGWMYIFVPLDNKAP
jgi:hypothetical protein